jgi:hypothetical protein
MHSEARCSRLNTSRGLDIGLTKTVDLVAALRTGGIDLYGSLTNEGADLKKTDLQIGAII